MSPRGNKDLYGWFANFANQAQKSLFPWGLIKVTFCLKQNVTIQVFHQFLQQGTTVIFTLLLKKDLKNLYKTKQKCPKLMSTPAALKIQFYKGLVKLNLSDKFTEIKNPPHETRWILRADTT